jgi:hypothetical protein
MQGEAKELWLYLCGLAAEEKDPVRLSKLVHEICELLDAKQRRLEVKPPEAPQQTTAHPTQLGQTEPRSEPTSARRP